jgi:hypothetical protein
MPAAQLTDQTARRLALLAAAWELSESETVERLIDRLTERPQPAPARDDAHLVPVHFHYRGRRYEGLYDRRDKSLTVTGGGTLGTRRFRRPSPAAAAAVRDADPSVDPARNGWQSWVVTATGRPLQSIRYA